MEKLETQKPCVNACGKSCTSKNVDQDVEAGKTKACQNKKAEEKSQLLESCGMDADGLRKWIHSQKCSPISAETIRRAKELTDGVEVNDDDLA